MKRLILAISAPLLLLAGCCEKNKPDPVTNYDKVSVLYSVGRNNLGYYLKDDINEMCNGESGAYIPEYGSRNALLIIAHLPASSFHYEELTESVLINVHRTKSGSVARDTVFRMEPEKVLTDAQVMKAMLNKVRELFPSGHCGIVLSSHGSGWLPNNYFASGEVEYGDSEPAETLAPAKGGKLSSFGQEIQGDDHYMMNIPDMVEGIPFHLDYLLFDACLMANIETVFELKDRASVIGVSATEILADGFNYKTLAKRLLEQNPASPKDVCQDYFEQYEHQTGSQRSASISLIDCSRLGNLATVCKALFGKYRDNLSKLNPADVQRFFRYDDSDELLKRGWFYDLLDIMDHAGITDAEHDELARAIADCVIYKAHTSQFLSEFDIRHFCGLSMAIPQFKDDKLKSFYKELSWNKATGLVK